MSAITDTFVNALLADASYVDNLAPGNTGPTLILKLSPRMTPELAKTIGDSFTVVSAINSPDGIGGGSGFDAVVWRGNAETPYAGQLFVSTRGTEGAADFLSDAHLALNSAAMGQLVDMVNWWLRISTPTTAFAKQIELGWVDTGATDPNGVPILTLELHETTSVLGAGLVTSADLSGAVSVNGHSLGGYLAAAFVRLFGTQANVANTTTFNSAGFAPGSESAFNVLQSVVGPSLGRSTFPGPGNASQTNVFAMNGLTLTTNTWWFEQQGRRVGIFNEQSTFAGTDVPNHFMYKLSDALALMVAMERLVPGLTIDQANRWFEAGSNVAAGSLEGVLDAIRLLTQGPSISRTAIGDVSDSASSRLAFHSNLATLQNSGAFGALQGRVLLVPVAGNSALPTQAHTDFAALLSLIALSPFVLQARSNADTAAVESALSSAWSDVHSKWVEDRGLTQAERDLGKANFGDVYLHDRQAMAQWLAARNLLNDSDNVVTIGLPGTASTAFSDMDSSRSVLIGAVNPDQRMQVYFGDKLDNSFSGFGKDDHLYGGAGADTLSGQGGADYLEGNADDDTLTGGTGNDRLLGGLGNDTYVLTTGDGNDTIIDSDHSGRLRLNGQTLAGGDWVSTHLWRRDSVSYLFAPGSSGNRGTLTIVSAAGTTTVLDYALGELGLNLPGAPAPVSAPPASHTFVGDLAPLDGDLATPGVQYQFDAYGNVIVDPNVAAADREDRLIGSADIDVLRGRGGADTARGAAGDDRVMGGAGADIVVGEAGADLVVGHDEIALADALAAGLIGSGSGLKGDWVDGGAGDDILIGHDGNDALMGGQGADVIVGGLGNDAIEGDASLTTVNLDWAITRSVSIEDNVTLYTSTYSNGSVEQATADVANGDVIDGGAGEDWINAGSGNDYVDGGQDNDVVFGEEGDDLLTGGDGNDVLSGDSLDWNGAGRNLAGALHGDDVLFGDLGDDDLTGNGGDDELYGGDGNDKLSGDDGKTGAAFHGSDLLEGGLGNDELRGGGGDDVLDGGEGNDQLIGDDLGVPGDNQGNDFLDGGLGNDQLLGFGGDDALFGGEGDDVLEGDGTQVEAQFHGNDYLDGQAGIDSLSGGGGDDVLLGGSEADVLDGGDGTDYVDGGADDDSLDGGTGNDTLVGGTGIDYLGGGTGDDTYAFETGDSFNAGSVLESVTDASGSNTIVFGAGISLGQIQVASAGGGQWLLIDYTAQDSLLVGTGIGGGVQNYRFADGTSLTYSQLIGRRASGVLYGQDSGGLTSAMGGSGNDSLASIGGFATLSGGWGNDTFIASGSGNRYLFDRGDGRDAITDTGGVNPGTGEPLPSSR